MGREQEEAVPAVEGGGARLHQPRLHMSSSWTRGRGHGLPERSPGPSPSRTRRDAPHIQSNPAPDSASWPVSAHLSSRDPGGIGHSLVDDFPWWHVPRVTTRTTSGVLLQHVDPLRLPPQGCWQTPCFPSPTPLLVSLHSAHLLHLTASVGWAIRTPFREPLGSRKPWVYRGTSLEGSLALCSFQHLLLNGFHLPIVTPRVPPWRYNMGMEAGVCTCHWSFKYATKDSGRADTNWKPPAKQRIRPPCLEPESTAVLLGVQLITAGQPRALWLQRKAPC